MKRSSRHGVVLILVLMVVALLSLTAYTFCDLMLTEREAVTLTGRQAQGRALVDSGVDMVRVFLMLDPDSRTSLGGLYDNEDQFRGRIVVDDPDDAFRGRVSIISAALDDEGNIGGGIRFGLESESARLSLNSLMLADSQGENAGRDLLMALPGMTEEIADAILDWVDEDDEPREFGAEIDHYSGLSPPYAPKNGPFESVEELLLVRGVTPALLYGLDWNRNALVEPSEGAIALDAEVDNTDGSIDRGWSAYLTLHGKERNVNSLGEPRIYLNTDDMQQLYDDLLTVFDEEWATFIVAYRQNGPYRGSQDAESAGGGKLDLSKPARFPLSQVLDLVGEKVRVRFEGEDETTVLREVFPNEGLARAIYLPKLMEYVTVNASPVIPGRVNINQAPRTVLLAIPEMTEELADAIIGSRAEDPEQENPGRRHETWLLAEGLVTLDEMKAMMPYVTAAGDVYRAQVIGYFDGGGLAVRREVIIDGTLPLPEVIMSRNLSHLGRGYALETLGVDVASELQ